MPVCLSDNMIFHVTYNEKRDEELDRGRRAERQTYTKLPSFKSFNINHMYNNINPMYNNINPMYNNINHMYDTFA